MDCKQRTVDKLLQTLAVCLQRESLIRDENIFLLQNFKTNSNIQNSDKSKLSATQDNKEMDINNAPLVKIIENQLMIVLAIVTSVIKSLIKNYLIKLQMIIAKTIAVLIRITRITQIALTTQEQSNMMLAEMT